MNCLSTLDRLCAVCGLLLACGAAAADINRCRDNGGHVLLSDKPCLQQGLAADAVVTDNVPAAALSPPADEVVVITAARDEQEPVAEPKRSPWADLPHPLPHRPVTLDASTLQAAHSAMLVDDEMRRQRKLASVR